MQVTIMANNDKDELKKRPSAVGLGKPPAPKLPAAAKPQGLLRPPGPGRREAEEAAKGEEKEHVLVPREEVEKEHVVAHPGTIGGPKSGSGPKPGVSPGTPSGPGIILPRPPMLHKPAAAPEKPEMPVQRVQRPSEAYPTHPTERPVPGPSHQPKPSGPSGPSNLPMIISVIALILAIAALYIAFTGFGAKGAAAGLSAEDKQLLMGVASDVRSLKDASLSLTVPTQTSLHLSGTLPVAEAIKQGSKLFIPVTLKVNQKVVGFDARTGTPVQVQLNDTILTSALVDFDFSASNSTIIIENDIPVYTVSTGTLSLGNLSSRLDMIAAKIEQIAS